MIRFKHFHGSVIPSVLFNGFPDGALLSEMEITGMAGDDLTNGSAFFRVASETAAT